MWFARLTPQAAAAAALILVGAGIGCQGRQEPAIQRAQIKAAPHSVERDPFAEESPDEARPITVEVVQSKSAIIKHDYQCTIYGQHYLEVRAPADGYLAEVAVKEGQTVKKGDPLFKIRPPGDNEQPPDDRDRLASAAVGQAVMTSELWFRRGDRSSVPECRRPPDGRGCRQTGGGAFRPP